MFGLVGPDGSGKTTTIRMLCGILVPTRAERRRCSGYDILHEIRTRMKREIGYLSQRFSPVRRPPIDENIEFFAEINRCHDFRARRDELLEFTRLTPFRKRLAERLSGGMKQKLALACTLIHTPRDHLPGRTDHRRGSGLAPRFLEDPSELPAGGITIVMTTPYLDEAERCSRVALMNQGKAISVDTPAETRKRMQGKVLEIVMERVRDGFRLLKGHPGLREVQAFGDRLNVIVDDADAGMRDVERVFQRTWPWHDKLESDHPFS